MSDSDKKSAYAHKGDLTQGDIKSHLVRLTVPMIWGIMAIISFQLVDTFYIAMLGTKELAAITFTFPVTYIIFNVIMGIGIATSSVVSRLIGVGHWARVRRVTTHALLLSFIAGLILAILGVIFLDPLFRAFGASEEMRALIRPYMVIWLFGSILINTQIVGNAAMRAAGDSLSPALLMALYAGLNIILDPFFIFGWAGLPRLEMQGAAVATVLANVISFPVGIYIIARRKKMLSRSRRIFRLFGDSLKRLLFIALPTGLTMSIMPILHAVMIALLAKEGTEAVAAFGVASRVEAFAFIVVMALSTGMAPIIGQNWGAKNYGRVNKTLRVAIGFACLWSLGVTFILLVLAAPIAGLFTDEASVIEATRLYFWIIAPTYFLGNLVHGWSSAFNAMGKPQRTLIMIVTRLLILNIPLAFLGAHYYGMIGIFGSVAVTNAITGIVFHAWNRRYCLKQMDC